MRIYSMTATFGKLSHETLTLSPGLNIIHAPNEWGKSTWCAFLTAMLYGLDSRSHSTKTALSDKEHYTPWSGAPMSGKIDLNWNGRDITISRKTKGRVVFGDFRAYETHTGLPVPELTAQNCGQMLLGVEKAVFTRSAMIRLTDLPVTQDDTLRKRLNALVTTGDDSGTAEDLERKLRELRNRCRYNRTGLLPQAEAEAAALDSRFRELDALETQSVKLQERCAQLEQESSALENHLQALSYRTAQDHRRQIREAGDALREAQEKYDIQRRVCSGLPCEEDAKARYGTLLEVQEQWTRLQTEEFAVLPPLPPDFPFQTLTADEALKKVSKDERDYRRFSKGNLFLVIPGIMLLLTGILVSRMLPEYALAAAIMGVVGGAFSILWGILYFLRQWKAKQIAGAYGPISIADWKRVLSDYVNQLSDAQHSSAIREEQVNKLRQQTQQLCQGKTFADALAYWKGVCEQWVILDSVQQSLHQRQAEYHARRLLPTDALPPAFPDHFTISEAETHARLAENAQELLQLQHRLGQCQGQMESIGHRSALDAQRNALSQRIRNLEDAYQALTIALNTLEQARASLQRRFAPRITRRANEILSRLTDGRYDHLTLSQDFTLHTNSQEEDTLRTVLWRSDGTADLLYLALRLAIAGEIVPHAPLILDDALIRFDDQRLEKAMAFFHEESIHRQILLFTCHTRESKYEKPN